MRGVTLIAGHKTRKENTIFCREERMKFREKRSRLWTGKAFPDGILLRLKIHLLLDTRLTQHIFLNIERRKCQNFNVKKKRKK